MTRLCVNINKIATLRNSRGGDCPNVLEAAIRCQEFGAQGICVHPRPDERHIRKQDVLDIKPFITTEYNLEGYPSEEFVELALAVKPDQVTLCPDEPNQRTSDHGFDTVGRSSFLREVVGVLKFEGIRTSILVDPIPRMVEGAKEAGSDRVELFTEQFARLFPKDPTLAVAPFKEAAIVGRGLGLAINAGHDLSLRNLKYFRQNVPFLEEVSIGHALIADALYSGLKNTIAEYLACLR